MNSIEELRQNRFQFLNLLYEITEGDKFQSASINNIGSKLELDHSITQTIVRYLVDEGLVEHSSMGHEIVITHYGVKEIEDANSQPEDATKYFPSINNTINIQNMEGSQIQQGSISSNQTGTFNLTNGVQINEFLKLLKEKLPELELNSDDVSEIKSDITTLESQIESSRPKSNIIKESISSIQRILEGATGAVVAQQLIPFIPVLLSALGVGEN